MTIVETSLTARVFPNWKSTRDFQSDLILVRGKGTHYKPKAGGWVSVTGFGVATHAQLKSRTLTDIGKGCRRSSITTYKQSMRQIN